ncbi:MAG: alkaline phosphatase family protein [Flavitalea sp.]
MYTDKKYDTTLTLIYLPHLDYSQQKFGPDISKIGAHLEKEDKIDEGLIYYYSKTGAKIILLSEYGIGPVLNYWILVPQKHLRLPITRLHTLI